MAEAMVQLFLERPKFALYACRAVSNSDTGLSPFQLVYVRTLRGPLEWLHEMWDPADREPMQWVRELEKRLEVTREVAKEWLEAANYSLKAAYDKGAKLRSFNVGDMILLRIPGLEGKLEDLWDGPYEVFRKCNDVNHELAIPNRRSKCKVIHINNLKCWIPQQAHVYRIVVASDEVEEPEAKL